jgi:hypothetical protein
VVHILRLSVLRVKASGQPKNKTKNEKLLHVTDD